MVGGLEPELFLSAFNENLVPHLLFTLPLSLCRVNNTTKGSFDCSKSLRGDAPLSSDCSVQQTKASVIKLQQLQLNYG